MIDLTKIKIGSILIQDEITFYIVIKKYTYDNEIDVDLLTNKYHFYENHRISSQCNWIHNVVCDDDQ